MADERIGSIPFAARDEAAFEDDVRRYGPMVYRACLDILGNRDDAEDAFQATFLVLVRRSGAIRDPGATGRWLYEVACRISRRARVRAARRREQERRATAMTDLAPPADRDAADREVRPILHDEIGQLPAKLRDAIVLCYLQGLTVEVAAGQLGCPPSTLKSRLAKGRELLRSRLARRGLAASVLLLLLFSMTDEAAAAVPEALIDRTVRSGLDTGGTGAGGRVVALVLEEEGERLAHAPRSTTLILLLTLFALSSLAVVRYAATARSTPAGPTATAALTPIPAASPAPGTDGRALHGDAGHCSSE